MGIQNITITVSGDIGSGKTSLALLIKQLLEEKGIRCSLLSNSHITPHMKLSPDVVDMIKNRRTVTLIDNHTVYDMDY